MKLLASAVLFTLSLQASTAACQLLVLPSFLRTGNSPEEHTSNKGQLPIMNIPNILFPPSNNKDKDGSSGGSGELSISDVIGKERVISIFAGFTRDIDSISKRLDANDQNTTVLAPLNSELQKLPRKPWEDPEDYNELGASAYQGQSGEDRAQRNLRRFVEAHAVPMSPWKEGEKVNSIGGGKLWWEEKDGKKVVRFYFVWPLAILLGLATALSRHCTPLCPCLIVPFLLLRLFSRANTSDNVIQVQPGNIEVSSIASRVSNGEVVSDFPGPFPFTTISLQISTTATC